MRACDCTYSAVLIEGLTTRNSLDKEALLEKTEKKVRSGATNHRCLRAVVDIIIEAKYREIIGFKGNSLQTNRTNFAKSSDYRQEESASQPRQCSAFN